jgi:peptide/nickel transport system permease protein
VIVKPGWVRAARSQPDAPLPAPTAEEIPAGVHPPRCDRRWAPLVRAVGRKLLVSIGTIWVVSLLVFAAVDAVPIDPALSALGRDSTPEQRASFRARMGLDDPAPQRYLRWAAGMVRGDFGTSVISNKPVAPELIQRLELTLLLGSVSLLASIGVGLPLAGWAARRRSSALDLAASVSAIAITSVPEFVLAILVLLIGASQLRLLPVTSGSIVDGDARALVLPAVSLALAAAAYIFRLARVSLIEALSAPYVRTAILNGYSSRRILWRHVLPNASAVIVNVIALNAIFLLSGVLVIENVYAYPGIGTLLVQAIVSKDLPTIEAVALVTSALLVAINLVADGLVFALSPRLRTAGRR